MLWDMLVRQMNKILQKIKKNKYLLYHLKWQAGFIVIYPVQTVLLEIHSPLWLAISLGSVAGAVVFWYVDKWIFDYGKKK